MNKFRFAGAMLLACLVFTLAYSSGLAQETKGNRAERLEWFRDQGFGLFIHWGVDSQLGSVISHSMVAADDGYLTRYIEELPRTFNPRKFQPADWAVLAKLAGIRYVVFTAKHHSGFCMFETRTTGFGIMKTPFARDITAEVLRAFRDQGIAPGLYFSPDDFWWLFKNGITIQRSIPAVAPANNPGLLAHDRDQVRELFTRYGPIEVFFIDGPPEGIKELAWELQPGVVVTRGAIETPEQYIPGIPLNGAWEACLTMGTQWQYKPTNEDYKTGGQLISALIETRAKGGNLLLNVGPKPDGELPIEQEERLREIALWMFANSECIYGVRPWVITNEGEIWFTKAKDADTLYAIVKTNERWKYGEWRDLVLHSVRSTPQTEVRVLSQNDKVLEYQADVVPITTWRQEADGLHIRAMRAQRLYNDRKWPNPVVLRLTHVKPALRPPLVETSSVRWDAARGEAVCEGLVRDLGDASSLEVGFEFRNVTGMDLTERPGSWTAGLMERKTAAGAFSSRIAGWKAGESHEIRAVVRHPLLTLYGREVRLRVPGK